MLYLDISAKDFFEIYPHLKNEAVLSCQMLGLSLEQVKPYITKTVVGVIINPNSQKKLKVFTPRDLNHSKKLSELFYQ